MSIDDPTPLALAASAATIAAARDRIDDLVGRARSIAASVRWEAPSARAYRESAEDLLDRLREARARADAAYDVTRRAQAVAIANGTP